MDGNSSVQVRSCFYGNERLKYINLKVIIIEKEFKLTLKVTKKYNDQLEALLNILYNTCLVDKSKGKR